MKHIPLLLLLFCFGCKSEHKPKVEIYLLNERVEPYEGIPILSVPEFKGREDLIKLEGLQDIRYDTVFKELVFAGDFDLKKAILQEKPVFSDEEIVSFNSKSNELIIDSIAVERISKVKISMSRGNQFVITVDKKPILGGYFWSTFSSQWCHSYTIYIVHPNTSLEFKNISAKKNRFVTYKLEYGPYIPEAHKKQKPPYPKMLLEALKNTNRLIE